MKKFYFLALCFMLVLQIASATETEPNNIPSQASILALNAGDNGYLAIGDVDWWRVTTNADGKLSVTISPTTSIWVYGSLYDADGTSLFTTTLQNNTFVLEADGLAAGNYYIRIFHYYSDQVLSYSISNSLLTPAIPNDVEPNNIKSKALYLAQNGTKKGHIGYLNNQVRDTADWYKVTTNADGKMMVKLTPANGQYVWCTLYDKNGTTVLAQQYWNSTFYLFADGLAVGTYYIRIACYYTSGYSPYTITDSLTKAAYTNDAEPNNSSSLALSLGLNSSTTGHVGFYYNQWRDSTDWYKIQTVEDGRLRVNVNPQNGQYLWAILYDADKTTVLDSRYWNSPFTIEKDGLATGLYYLQVLPYHYNGFTPYMLSDSFFAPTQPADMGLNDDVSQADTLPLNGSVEGHIGYYYDHRRDSTDWYTVTTNADGELFVNINPVNGQYLWAWLLDTDGTTVLASGYWNSQFTISKNGLAQGKYYISLRCYYSDGFTPYILKDSLSPAALVNDPEPNGKKALALTLPLNGSKTGHVGYYNSSKRDSADWYKIYINADGRLRLTLTPANGQYLWLYLFDNDGTTVLGQNNATTTFTISRNDLAAGTYYIRVNAYYSDGFTPYTLSDSLFKATPANDVEPNDTKDQAISLTANATKTGHIGYYFKLKRDSSDWYKLVIKANKKIKLSLTPYNGQYITMELLDSISGNSILYGNSTSPFDLVKNSLPAGTYFIRIKAYYQDGYNRYKLTDSIFAPVVTADEITGISENKIIPPVTNADPAPADEVRLYPNPAASVVNIYFGKKIFEGDITVFNASGKLVKRITQTPTNIVRLNVNDLVKGMYVVKWVDKDKNTQSHKIFVAH